MTVEVDLEVRMVWVDTNPLAGRASLLRQAVEDSRSLPRGQAAPRVDVQLLECTSISKAEIMRLAEADASPIFVVITEDEMASFTNGVRLPRIPCASIRLGYDLIGERTSHNDIYFVMQNGRGTGIEILSLLASGASGVIGSEALFSAEVMRTLVNRCIERKSSQSLIVVGEPNRLLDHLTEFDSRSRMEPKKWELLLALCEIPLARLPGDGSSTNIGIAREITKFETRTGYVVNTTTQRWIGFLFEDILDYLDPTWEPDGLEGLPYQIRSRRRTVGEINMLELPYLPLYTRVLGFPNCLLPIRNSDQITLTSDLYSILRKTRIHGTQTLGGISFSRVSVE